MSGSNKSSPKSAPKSSASKTAREDGRLRLRAVGPADLQVMSACLQDAVVPLADIAYLVEERRFLLVANRLRREARGAGERTLTGLCFEGVSRVQRKGFTAGAVDGFLSLLSIQATTADVGAAVELTFSGGAAIRIVADRVQARLDDLGEAWPTQWTPEHDE